MLPGFQWSRCAALRADGNWHTAGAQRFPAWTIAELSALLMSQPSALGHPALAAASERAFGKLLAAMPQRMQTQAASIRARLHIDPVGWHPSSGGLDLLPIVQDAIARDCKLSFLYSRADGESGVRTVDPFGIVAKQGIWYLVARAPAGMRTYRISRMQDAVVLAVTFERPANFDLATHWKTATAQLQQKREQFRATLALAPDAAVVLRRWCRASPAPEVQHAIPDKWTVLHVFFESQDEARFVSLGFGSRAHVLAPVTLRDEVLEEMSAAVARPPIAV